MAAMTASSLFSARSACVERFAHRIIQGGIAALCLAQVAGAQAASGTLRGRVVDQVGAPIGGVAIHLTGTALGASSDARGDYVVGRVPAASYTAVIRRTGFAPDSFAFTILGDETVTHDLTLRPATQELERVIISASPRLNETIEQALSKQKNVDNIVSMLSGDVI